jgi:acetyltransferase
VVSKLRTLAPLFLPQALKFPPSNDFSDCISTFVSQPALSHRIAHERLTRICFIDYDREMALVVDRKHPETGNHEVLGAGRLSKSHGTNEGEFAMLVSDVYQKQGVGTMLLEQLVQIGRDEGLERITAEILHENRAMQRVCEKVGFTLTRTPEFVKAELPLI